jgi:16S rRNA processing protein RimM
LSTEYFLVGRVRRAHGIRGELVVEALTDAPDAIFAPGRRVFVGTRSGDLSRDARELRILRSSPFKGGLIVAFEGILDKTEADTWRDRTFLVPADEVSPPAEDELFVHELVGMRVVMASDRREVGEISQVLDLPQGYVIEVVRPKEKPVLLPFDTNTVVAVDPDARVVQIDPVEGLLD